MLFLAVLAGCARGPDPDALTNDVQARLDAQFVRQRSRKLAKHRYARQMRDLITLCRCPAFIQAPLGDVDYRHQDHRRLGTAHRRQKNLDRHLTAVPAQRVRVTAEAHGTRSQLGGEAAAIGLVRRAHPFGDQSLDSASDQNVPAQAEQGLRLCVRKRNLPPDVDEQHRVRRRFDNGAEALAAGLQLGLAVAQLRRRSLRHEEVPGQFVAHRDDDDEEPRCHDRGRPHGTGEDQHCEPDHQHDAGEDATPNDRGTAARYRVAKTPQRDRGVDDEGDQQQVGDLGDDLPRIERADRG